MTCSCLGSETQTRALFYHNADFWLLVRLSKGSIWNIILALKAALVRSATWGDSVDVQRELMRNLTTSELDLSLFRFVKGKHFFRDTNMDARLHCVDLDTAYNQVQTKPPSRLFTIFQLSLKWPGGQKAGESLDVDPRVAELVERRRHSLPRSPRGAAAQHGRGAAGDRDVLRVPARGDQADLRLSSHQLGLAVQHDWQVTLKFHLWKMDLAPCKNASFRQLRSQLNSLGTMLPTVSELQRR